MFPILKKLSKRSKIFFGALLAVIFLWHIVSGILVKKLDNAYFAQSSQIIYDRGGQTIQINPNQKGYYNQFLENVPDNFKTLLLKKEDQMFYFHPGINPSSILREVWAWAAAGKRTGSSTLSQQLVKTLLGNEQDRNFKNKFSELFYTLGLEWRYSKNKILTMYLNSAYFGQKIQGLKEASKYYFNSEPENLTLPQIFSLISSLNSPSAAAPLSSQNLIKAKLLAKEFKTEISNDEWQNLKELEEPPTVRRTETAFEINTLGIACDAECKLTVDARLSESIREILRRNLTSPTLDTATNGAVFVIKLPENEILSIIGTPDPNSSREGMQVNMALKPRAIGSTSKPFIYLKAFEKGARPYTLVSDEEIKYQIAAGFDFFPKNFDGQYRGIVTLHQALSNSLNIPSVQTLEFAGLDNFYKFMREDLGFSPAQPLENYELGLALGALEMDLATLSSYFTIFPQTGLLKPLTVCKTGCTNPYLIPPMTKALTAAKQAGKPAEVQLINKILNDRETGVEQFGLKSNLNLPYKNYALKTGTSRDYHDSWTIGYSPDFLVGVWVGNSDNSAMRQVTGLSGAAKIWRETMLLLYNSPYNQNTPFDFNQIVEYNPEDTVEYGLKNDNYDAVKNLMLKTSLILSPHEGDKFLLQKNASVPLTAADETTWMINGKFFGRGKALSWPIISEGVYTIEASTPSGKKENITIFVNKE